GAALAGAVDICAARLREMAEARRIVREALTAEGRIVVGKLPEHEGKATKFDTYANYDEPFATMPSHRFLAVRRGEAEGVLRVGLELEGDGPVRALERLAKLDPASPWAGELARAVGDAYTRLVAPSVKSELRIDKKLEADRDAVEVFAQNLRELLLASPFGGRRVLGIDPGQRTGCKCVVVDETGKLLDSALINLVQGSEAEARGRRIVAELVKKHRVAAVAVGNGTHGRETKLFASEVLAAEGLTDVVCVAVSEAGASVYSASEVAREEFPDLDLTVRGAISIARRLQDPLAELVKIDPKSIGVGQYQHDVYQPLLARKLDDVVESCVSSVGVELNTASSSLLARVAGIGPTVARKIVAHRDAHGAFPDRQSLREVSGVGPRTFEQAAGFLRVRDGAHPLDASAVHPERYPLVERMAADLGVPVGSLVGNPSAVAAIDPRRYESGDVGSFTLADILAELKKPGRDPRSSFEPPKFRDDVTTLEHLAPGMELEGVVTNVTAFGAFVDVGVHQDGLVHVSKLAERFVKDPSEVVKVGDRLRVRVLAVDLERKRISLTARRDEATPRPAAAPAARTGHGAQAPRGGGHAKPGHAKPGHAKPGDAKPGDAGSGQKGGGPGGKSFANNPFADLLRR
ncbi:MAG: helix-hairpin-helix domain-containing protein, partial [Myxococcales bacterium]|nr:helix-hairpin-helix domain-containing protein [Myxococcales bacterium]